MNVVVEMTEKTKTVTFKVPRVTMELSDYEASIVKLALEHLRSPETWYDEAQDTVEYEGPELDGLISTLEKAQIFYDGVYI